ncbi:uncharacterized protein [Nicotiana tomentosiformis]|uniref:uncharacterized protein n=1 Tax=Nicotiana tomentosiformis TaxID=4098 RepID=UPI00388CB3F7
MEDEGEDESTAENFKQVTREGDFSPTASAKRVALMKPFQKKGLIDRYKRRLNIETAYENIKGQIWLFFDAVVEWELVEDTEQQTTNFVKPFKFLNFWTKHATFTNVVRQNWEVDFIGDPFFMFKQNIKRVKAALSKWSRETFGDIFMQLDVLEDIVRVKEIKKLQLKRIKSASGVWVEDQEQLAIAAVDFYQKQFTNEGDASEFSLLNNVPSMVSMDQNLEHSRLPTIEEVRVAVFELSGESASGPDGFTGLFYQTCWDVIGAHIYNMVLHFYGGAALPKSITHTNLVLLPKKPRVETFSDLRPISLSNFINKVLSRVLHDRLESFLPSLIAPNQSGFVKGRGIFENILLTQEIVTDIRLRGKPANVSSGFFKLTRGVKQGDPLSPALFILSAEVLFRRRKDYYEDLIKKVKAKLHSWKGKFFSFGGKATLISSVLQSMPVHMLSVLDPPNSILGYLHKTFSRFFWSTKE